MKAARSVDAVIVTRDTREMTMRCIESLLSEGSLDIRCNIVDNASEDGTAEAIAGRWPEITVIRNEHNAGYGTACNQGLRDGTADYVLILNSDIVVRPGGVSGLVRFLEDNSTHVAAGGCLVDPGTDDIQVGHVVRRLPQVHTQIAQMLGLERTWPANPVSRGALGFDADYGRTQDVEQPPGSCLACRRPAFEAVGGFDESFFYWYEDVDLCRRLLDGGRIAYVHDAVFEHLGSATFAQWDRPERIRSWYGGVFRYFDKHHGPAARCTIRSLGALLASLRALVALPSDRAKAQSLWAVARLGLRPGSVEIEPERGADQGA